MPKAKKHRSAKKAKAKKTKPATAGRPRKGAAPSSPTSERARRRQPTPGQIALEERYQQEKADHARIAAANKRKQKRGRSETKFDVFRSLP